MIVIRLVYEEGDLPTSDSKIVESQVYSLETLFQDKFDVDFYQREYVWQRKQVEDLVMDLSTEFLKNWNPSGFPSSITLPPSSSRTARNCGC